MQGGPLLNWVTSFQKYDTLTKDVLGELFHYLCEYEL